MCLFTQIKEHCHSSYTTRRVCPDRLFEVINFYLYNYSMCLFTEIKEHCQSSYTARRVCPDRLFVVMNF